MASNGSSITLREQRWKLCERQQWRCYWCHEPMQWVVLNGKGTLPLDAATLDHLDDKWSNQRGAYPGQFRRVAAHKSCNEKRSRENQQGNLHLQRQKSREGHIK